MKLLCAFLLIGSALASQTMSFDQAICTTLASSGLTNLERVGCPRTAPTGPVVAANKKETCLALYHGGLHSLDTIGCDLSMLRSRLRDDKNVLGSKSGGHAKHRRDLNIRAGSHSKLGRRRDDKNLGPVKGRPGTHPPAAAPNADSNAGSVSVSQMDQVAAADHAGQDDTERCVKTKQSAAVKPKKHVAPPKKAQHKPPTHDPKGTHSENKSHPKPAPPKDPKAKAGPKIGTPKGKAHPKPAPSEPKPKPSEPKAAAPPQDKPDKAESPEDPEPDSDPAPTPEQPEPTPEPECTSVHLCKIMQRGGLLSINAHGCEGANDDDDLGGDDAGLGGGAGDPQRCSKSACGVLQQGLLNFNLFGCT